MAQTRRKRTTKHRGNAAGVVESRGRTGRKPTKEEKSGPVAGGSKKPLDKRDQPPTWRGAFMKAMVASVLFILVVVFALPHSNGALEIFPVVLAGYTAVSYYTDRWVYNRRMRRKAKEGGAQAR